MLMNFKDIMFELQHAQMNRLYTVIIDQSKMGIISIREIVFLQNIITTH